MTKKDIQTEIICLYAGLFTMLLETLKVGSKETKANSLQHDDDGKPRTLWENTPEVAFNSWKFSEKWAILWIIV